MQIEENAADVQPEKKCSCTNVLPSSCSKPSWDHRPFVTTGAPHPFFAGNYARAMTLTCQTCKVSVHLQTCKHDSCALHHYADFPNRLYTPGGYLYTVSFHITLWGESQICHCTTVISSLKFDQGTRQHFIDQELQTVLSFCTTTKLSENVWAPIFYFLLFTTHLAWSFNRPKWQKVHTSVTAQRVNTPNHQWLYLLIPVLFCTSYTFWTTQSSV